MPGLDTTLVGRHDELSALARAAAAVGAGERRLVMLEGEAGIGKTTLLDTLAAEAAGAGVQVLRADASRLDAVRPFGPLLDALSVTQGETVPSGAGVDAAVRAARDALAGSSTERLSPLQAVPEQRSALVEALVAVLGVRAEAGPTALLVDDLHEADAATVATLALMARRAVGLPVLLAVATRPGSALPEWEALAVEWREAGALDLRVGPLDPGSVRVLLERLTDGLLPPELLGLAPGAGGNPFLLRTLVAAYDETAEATRGDGREAGYRLEGVVRRMSRLEPAAAAVLQVCAVLGRRFDVDDLVAVLDRPAASVLVDLAPSLDAGLLVEDGDALAFQHELVREAVAARLPSSAVSALHLDAARRLRATGAPLHRVVAHYLAGARPGDVDAAEAMVQVARDTVATAPAPAADLLATALDLLPVRHPGRVEVVADLIDAMFWCGRFDEALALGTTTLGRPLADAVEARVHESLGRALTLMGRPSEAIEHFDALAGLPDRAGWASALAGVVRVFALDLDGAVANAERALVLASGSAGASDPWAEGLGEIVLSWVENVRGYFDRAAERCRRVAALADASPGLELHRLLPYLFLGFARINAGREAEGMAAIDHGRAVAMDLGTVWALPFYQYAHAQAAWTSGRLDELVEACDEGLRLAADHQTWLAAPYAYAVSAAGLLYRGRTAEAGRRLDQGEALLASGGAQYGLEWLVWIRALWLEETGDGEAALAMLVGAAEVAEGLQAGAALALVGPDLVRMHLSRGDEGAARRVLDLMAVGRPGEEEVGGPDGPAPVGGTGDDRAAVDLLVDRARGVLDGDPAAVERARRRHLDRGWTVQAVLDEEALLVAYVRAGRVDAAKAQLRSCVAASQEHHLPLVAARVKAAAADLGLGGPRRSSAASFGWEALTDAERQVVDLAAQGRSNAQVAEALGSSRRTVESHLSRAYRKLGISNRTELAVIAHQRRD